MWATWKQNRIYTWATVLMLSLGGLSLCFIEKGDLIVYFSEGRTEILDLFFIWMTKLGEAVIYLLLILLFLFIRFRIALLLALTGLSSLLLSTLLKNVFQHPRPKRYFEYIGELDTLSFVEGISVNGSATTSFPSGHTLSAFALFTVLAFVVKRRWAQLAFAMVAVFAALSRVYLVQHFLEDVVLGGLLGFILGSALYYWVHRLQHPRWDRALARPKK